MPTLDWIGKKAVVNHHQHVPFHLLKERDDLSVIEPDCRNIIIHGDNLLALKALLPYYAKSIQLVYIDPPYNTGEEKWMYNDNVSSPEMKEWLGKIVGKEADDLSRHDKWLCMMYPRLKLLQQLLNRKGIIAVSIDDNELTNLGIMMDEIFGAEKRLACIPWLAEPSGGKQKTALRKGHEYLVVYHNGDDSILTREEKSVGALDKKDKFGKYRKGRELLKWGDHSLREDREFMWFPLRAPDGTEVYPVRNDGRQGRWRLGSKNPLIVNLLADHEYAHWEKRPYDDGVVVDGKTERWVPYEKIRDPKKSFGWDTWLDSHGYNADATRELKEIFGEKPFNTPKPTQLLKWVISLVDDEDALILDSFAGSGTTAHAVLQLNKEGGNRRFIAVEMKEDIIMNVTVPRIQKVISGYGSTEGTGGGFHFCELSDPLYDERGNINKTVNFGELAKHVYFTETGEPLPGSKPKDGALLGIYNGTAIYLLYNGILKDRSPDGGNVLTRAILSMLPHHDGPKVIYGTACKIGSDQRQSENLTFKQLPYKIRTGGF